MIRKSLPLWLGAIGTLLLAPGILWVMGSMKRLSDDDARVALQPLKRIPLDRINQGPISVTLRIPNAAQWTKIRKIWGEPELLISAVDAARNSALCLPEMPVRIEVTDPTRGGIPLQAYGRPYGYSSTCASSSLRFHAAPGSELILQLARTSRGTVPAGDLILVSDWFNTKDKLVALDLDKSTRAFLKWLSVPGFLLVASGVAVFFANLRR